MVRANQQYRSNGSKYREGMTVSVDAVRKATNKEVCWTIALGDKVVFFVETGSEWLMTAHVDDFTEWFERI